ncbi:MAG: hypothetical protein WCM76_13695 [Bacteroidota bacterium]
MKATIPVLVLSLAALFGCSKSSDTGSTYTSNCTGAEKSWATDVKPIITSTCSGCHSSFTTYNGIYASRSGVKTVIAAGTAHHSVSLTTEQKDKVSCWIDNGAPNN